MLRYGSERVTYLFHGEEVFPEVLTALRRMSLHDQSVSAGVSVHLNSCFTIPILSNIIVIVSLILITIAIRASGIALKRVASAEQRAKRREERTKNEKTR